MTCYKPFTGIRFGYTGSVQIFPNGYDPGEKLKEGFQKIPIPCGHCIGCRLEKSATWADRLMCELQYHDKACFLTLTYDDKNLPCPTLIDLETGQYVGRSSVKKEHLQKFIKDLRNYLNRHTDEKYKIRYFGVGEYGEETKRPHYHIILFGYDFSDDRIVYRIDSNGFIHYKSNTLYNRNDPSKSIWKFGIIDIADVSWQDCAYVARYTTKKLYGEEAKVYEELGIEPEFALMSNKPGIGYQYLQDHKDDYIRYGELVMPTKEGAHKVKQNRYFNRLISEDIDDDSLRVIRKKRAERSKFYELARLEKSELTYSEQNAVDLKNKENAMKRIKRNGVDLCEKD